MTKPILYCYDADVLDVYDGDTCRGILDLGLDVKVKTAMRLHGINAPELRSGEYKTEGLAARDFLRALIVGRRIRIQSLDREKYGRLLVRMWVLGPDGQPGEKTVNDMLVEAGHAKPYMLDR